MAFAPISRAWVIIRSYAVCRACSHISVYAPMFPPTMDLSPPRIPWLMVGARTMRPRTRPLYSRTRRPSTANVVDTIIEDARATKPPLGDESVGLGQDGDVFGLIGGDAFANFVLGVHQHDHGLMPPGFLRSELRVGDDDDVVAGVHQPGRRPVDADRARAALAGDGVRLEPVAVVDVDHLDPLEGHDAGGVQELGVDGDRAFVVQLGLRHRGAMQFGFAQGQVHDGKIAGLPRPLAREEGGHVSSVGLSWTPFPGRCGCRRRSPSLARSSARRSSWPSRASCSSCSSSPTWPAT